MAVPLLSAAAALAAWNWIDSTFQIADDVSLARKSLAVKRRVGGYLAENKTTADFFEDQADAHARNDFLVFEGRSLSYGDVEAAANRVAHWGRAQGWQQGDVVALVMANKPEYVIFWLGLSKIGVTTAMINYNLKGRALVHSVKAGNAKAIIFDTEFTAPVEAALGELQALVGAGSLFAVCGAAPAFAESADGPIASAPAARPPRELRAGIKTTDAWAYIYTSGTTGLPKAAVVPHVRFLTVALSFATLFQIRETDRVYTALPLYHTAGGVCGVGMAMSMGATQVIAKKFSATRFFADCARHRATVVQYIGELCRYLSATPPSAADRAHQVRIAIGNGLRPEVWPGFQERFGIPEIGEFYGATEGNAALVNHCTQPSHQGAVGRGGLLFRLGTGMKLARFDVENEAPVRGPDGFCIECGVDEPGELLGLVKANDPTTHFKGYTSKEATEKKLIRNAFKKDDLYFRTGDLLSRDANGCWHFVDRIGDTFRWKGENVSTTEVAEAVSTYPGVVEANVYGVEVPGKDGRAPMASIVAQQGGAFDVSGLHAHLARELPSYAIPLFLRMTPEQPLTGTFKHQKVALRKEGCNPANVPDPMMWLDPAQRTYVGFGPAEYGQLASSKL